MTAVTSTNNVYTGVHEAAWQPDTCQVGPLVRRPGGPPRQILKVKRFTPVGYRKAEKGARDKVTKRRRRKEGVERGRGPRDPYM